MRYFEPWDKATLTNTHEEFHQYTILEMAGTSESQLFLSHPGVWNKTNEIWTDKNKKHWFSGLRVYIFEMLMMVLFVVLFGKMILTSICHTPDNFEYILLFWVLSLLLEEIRQFYAAGNFQA